MADLTDVTFRTATDFGQFIEQGFGVPAYAVFSPALGMMPEIGGQWKGSSPGKHPLMPERYEEDDMFGILTECLPGRHHVTKQQNFDVETKHETTTFARRSLGIIHKTEPCDGLIHQPSALSNEQIAAVLEEVAELLEAQGANAFRVRAYRGGARTLRQLATPTHQILTDEGVVGLMKLPGIGRSLANAIHHLVWSHRLPLLERLRGEHIPERLFATVPNIGKALGRRIHDELGIETLAELEAAANDGRLAQVPGMGSKRLQPVRESLSGRFRAQRMRPAVERENTEQVPVEELLDVDGEVDSDYVAIWKASRASHCPRA